MAVSRVQIRAEIALEAAAIQCKAEEINIRLKASANRLCASHLQANVNDLIMK